MVIIEENPAGQQLKLITKKKKDFGFSLCNYKEQ